MARASAAVALAVFVSSARGGEVCRSCHAALQARYEASPMGRSLAVPGALPRDDASVMHPLLPLRFGVTYRDGAWHQWEEPSGERHRLELAIGSGTRGSTFAIRRGSALIQAPLSYYAAGAKWDSSPGGERAEAGFSRLVNEDCLACHGEADQGWRGVGCERCHGDGRAHAAGKRTAIVNPVRLPARLAEEICLACHEGGDVRLLRPGRTWRGHRPGEWLFDTIAVFRRERAQPQPSDALQYHSAMRSSACYRSGKLTCVSCHSVHGGGAAGCLGCHQSNQCADPGARRVTGDWRGCATCHMPRRGVASVSHAALTVHVIGRAQRTPLGMHRADRDLWLFNPPGRAGFTLPPNLVEEARRRLPASLPSPK